MKRGYTIENRKMTIISAGYVKSSIPYVLSLGKYRQGIVLIDISKEKIDQTQECAV